MSALKMFLFVSLCLVSSAAEPPSTESFIEEIDEIAAGLEDIRQSLQAVAKSSAMKQGDAPTLIYAYNILKSATFYVATIRRISVAMHSLKSTPHQRTLRALLLSQCKATEHELQSALIAINGFRPLAESRALLEDLGRLRGVIERLRNLVGAERLAHVE
jgi:hypothetical protein